ncbi:retrotransposon protein, putative, ty1-copia subclass [Tanacetum coccineum]
MHVPANVAICLRVTFKSIVDHIFIINMSIKACEDVNNRMDLLKIRLHALIPKLDGTSRVSKPSQDPQFYYGFHIEDDKISDSTLSELDEPANYKEAMASPEAAKCKEAMKSEIQSMYDNQVWNLVDTTPGLKTVGCKWIFKKKTDMDGKVHTYKARLVTKGYTQTYRIDYEETFSPVAKIKSIRIMLAMAAFHDYEIWQMDVKTAFLNRKLTEDVFHEKVTQFGFSRSEDESCIYVKVSGSVVVFLVLYVDDILLIGNDILTLQSVKDWLGKYFVMKYLGDATYILGIKIYKDRSKRLIGLSQDTYLDKVLKRFRIENSKKENLPLHHGIKISKDLCLKTDDELDKMSRVPYASAIGSIMYAMTCTRPDVSFSLSMASKEAIWMKNFIRDLGVVSTVQDPIEIFCDYESAVALTKEPKDHGKSKHIERKYHFVRSKVEGHVFMKDIRSKDNPVDPFTKSLAKSKHDEHATSIAVALDGTLCLVDQDRVRPIIVDDLSKWETVGFSVQGLGTHSIEETINYFQNLNEHIQHFQWVDNHDNDVVHLAFSAEKILERKIWISEPQDGTYDPKAKSIRYLTFFNTVYKDHAIHNVKRSMPSMPDGFTCVRRKVLHTALSKISETIMTVQSFGGHVSTFTHYRHGNENLETAIQRMLHSNVNVLDLISHSTVHARYSETKLHHMTQYLFHKDDEVLLNYLYENGDRIEPAWFVPIIPMILANGAIGVAIGWCTTIPSYNPRDLIADLRRLMKGEEMLKMIQWHKSRQEGNKSTANMYVLDAQSKLKKYDTPEKLLEDFYPFRLDLYEKRKTSMLHELKIASLQLKSKEKFAREIWDGDLFKVLRRKNERDRCVVLKERDFKSSPSIEREARKETQREEDVAEEDVAAEGYDGYQYLLSLPILSFNEKYIQKLEGEMKEMNEKLEHLTTSTPKSLWLKDLAALDEQLALEHFPEAKYTKAEQKARAKNEKEKISALHKLKIASLQLKSKERFVHEVWNGDLVLSEKLKYQKCVELEKKGFESLPSIKSKAREKETQEEEDVAAEGYDGYDYLLSLPALSFGPKYIEELEEERKATDKKIEHLTTSTPMSVWLKDLAALLDEQLAEHNREAKIAMLYSQAGMVDNALKVFDEMLERKPWDFKEQSICGVVSVLLGNGVFGERLDRVFEEYVKKTGFKPGSPTIRH